MTLPVGMCLRLVTGFEAMLLKENALFLGPAGLISCVWFAIIAAFISSIGFECVCPIYGENSLVPD